MKAEEFCYWLQGFFELGNTAGGMDPDQLKCVERHLALVFLHDIDPKAGPPEHQAKLNDAHAPPKAKPVPSAIGGVDPVSGLVYRC